MADKSYHGLVHVLVFLDLNIFSRYIADKVVITNVVKI